MTTDNSNCHESKGNAVPARAVFMHRLRVPKEVLEGGQGIHKVEISSKISTG